MLKMIFTPMNMLVLVVILIICYTFWKPFIRGKKTKAVVDGYCHPKEGKDKDQVWCYRFMYREVKAGKRLYCYSRRHFDTKEEMSALYPKGSEVDIRYYEVAKDGDMMAVITADKEDQKKSVLYTLIAVLGGLGMAVGYVLLVLQLQAM